MTGIEKICNSIIKCWASLFNERAVAYRIKNGFPHEKVTMAVVVQKWLIQKYLDLFTADPMTSDCFTTVIEAVKGLGEDLILGRKNPFVWKLRQGKLQKVSDGEDDLPLEEKHILELAELGNRIEEAFGCEQDIEWFLIEMVFLSFKLGPLLPCTLLGLSMLKKSGFYSFFELDGRMYADITYDFGTIKGRRAHLSETRIKDPLMHNTLKDIIKRKEYIKNIPKGPSSAIALEGRWAIIWQAISSYLRGDETEIDAYVQRQKSAIEGVKSKLEGLSGVEALQFILDDQKNMRITISDPAGAGTILTAMILISVTFLISLPKIHYI